MLVPLRSTDNMFFAMEGRTQLVLRKWKADLGEKRWRRLSAVTCTGTPKSEGIGATTRGNGHFSLAFRHLEALMGPRHERRFVISASSVEEAEQTIADVSVSNSLANHTWTTPAARRQSGGMYQSLVTPSATLANGYIPRILAELDGEQHGHNNTN